MAINAAFPEASGGVFGSGSQAFGILTDSWRRAQTAKGGLSEEIKNVRDSPRSGSSSENGGALAVAEVSYNDSIIDGGEKSNSSGEIVTEMKQKAGAQYSIKTIPNTNKRYVQADYQVIDPTSPLKPEKQVERFINENVRKGEDVLIPTQEGDSIFITARSAYKTSDRRKTNLTTRERTEIPYEIYLVKANAAGNLDELIEISRRIGFKEDDGKHKNGIGKDGFEYRSAYFRDIDGKYYLVKLTVGINENNKTFYNISRIEERGFPGGDIGGVYSEETKKVRDFPRSGSSSENGGALSGSEISYNDSIMDGGEKSNSSGEIVTEMKQKAGAAGQTQSYERTSGPVSRIRTGLEALGETEARYRREDAPFVSSPEHIKRAREATHKKDARRTRFAYASEGKNSAEKSGRMLGADEGTVNAVSELSDRLGREIIFFEQKDGKSDIKGYTKDGAIYLNARLEGSPWSVIAHELTHIIEGTAGYGELNSYVLRYYDETSGDAEGELAALIEKYRKHEVELSREEAERELVAKWVEEKLFGTNGREIRRNINRLASENRSLAARLLEALRRLAERLSGSSYERQLSYLREVFASALRESVTGATEKELFSINPDFESEYDAWDKKTAGGYFKLGRTSKAFESINIKPADIYFDKQKILKIKREHPDMTDSVIKQIPSLLEDPIIIMQSQTVVNRVVVLGEVYDDNGRVVSAALELTPQGRIGSFVKVASAYGRTDKNLQNLIKTSEVLYVDPDKKRTDTWLKALRVQFPSAQPSYGSINNITYTERNVKGYIERKSDNFDSLPGDIELALRKAGWYRDKGTGAAKATSRASRVVDETGAPLPVYQGEGFLFSTAPGRASSEAEAEAALSRRHNRHIVTQK